ncbi:AraC family transcriptional regulator [Paenibacillus psychroresistens]|nr:helix-turn-helix transcriptional regulator [Paenibacillus psychroresistens]
MKDENNRLAYQYYPNIKSEIYLYGAHRAKVEKPWVTLRHLHHVMFEINLVLEGCQTATLDKTIYEQKACDLILIPPMRQHEYKVGSLKPLQYFVMHVQVDDPTFLHLMNEACDVFYPNGGELNLLILPDVQAIMELLQINATKISLLSKLCELMDKLERYFLKQRIERTTVVETLPIQIAKKIEALVAVQLGDEEIPGNWFEGIADTMGFSLRHCHRVFQKTYHMAPRDYLAAIRQQEAMHLLLNSDESIEWISRRVGYSNVQSFIRQFSKWTSLTPGGFRKKKATETIYLTPFELR